MKNKCLYCYKEIKEDGIMYHPACAKKIFGRSIAPILPYSRDNIEDLALQIIDSSSSITGVQAKISLEINKGGRNEPEKLTIVGLWGNYILKPQSPKYNSMPELEDLTMKLAEIANIKTANHSLIRMSDGELAYITKRMDRGPKGEKYSMLDMCQLSNRLTEHKYLGSYSQLAETIKKYSITPLLDVQRFWELLVFSWITGNSDMHCKNFSLLETVGIGYQLSAAYDLLPIALTGSEDVEELALPLVSNNNNEILVGFTRDSFLSAMIDSGITPQYAHTILSKFLSYREKWIETINISFLNEKLKEDYISLIQSRLSVLA